MFGGGLVCVVVATVADARMGWWRAQVDYLKPPGSHDPHAADAFVGSPSLLQTSETSWLASHDRFFDENVGTAYIFGCNGSGCVGPTSNQDNEGWARVGQVSPMYWAQMFHAKGKAYIIGTSSDLTGAGHLMISRCTSIPCTGRGWTRPTQLFAGSGLEFHAAPTPVATAADGRLFRAVDIIVDGGIQVVMLVGTAECVDYTAPECWRRSQGVSYDPKWWPGSSQPSLPQFLRRDGVGAPRMWEEPGAIVDGATGAVTAMVRLDHPLEACSSLDECNRAALLSYDVANNHLSFVKIVQFPSGCNKFAIRQDTRSKEGYFYALTNPATQGIGTCGQRNEVVIARSPNLIDWQTCGVVLWDDTGLGVAESIAHTGLQYIDWRFVGSDIVAAVRAGYNGSTTYHDANQLLITRIDNYSGICDGLTASGSNFSLGIVHDGLAAWNNRAYVWTGVPPVISGLTFTKKGGGVPAAITIAAPSNLAGPQAIFAGVCTSEAGHNAEAFAGWTNTNATIAYTDTGRSVLTVLTKLILPGTKLELPDDSTWCGTVAFF